MFRSVSSVAMPVVLGLCPWLCAAAHADGIQFVDTIVRTEQLKDTGDTGRALRRGNRHLRSSHFRPRLGGTITYFVTALDSADNLCAGDDLAFTVAAIPGDLDGDGVVGVADLLILLGNWGPCADCKDCPADIDGNCAVGVSDLLILLGNWG